MACQFFPPAVLGQMNRLVELHLQNVRTRLGDAGLNRCVPDVLIHHFLVAEELAVRRPIFHNTRLAGAERHFLVADIDEHALEHFAQVEHSAGACWKHTPASRVRLERDRGVRIQRLVQQRELAAEEVPRQPGRCPSR
jgi:hypothetical protein